MSIATFTVRSAYGDVYAARAEFRSDTMDWAITCDLGVTAIDPVFEVAVRQIARLIDDHVREEESR